MREELTPAGAARREQMQSMLLQAVGRRRRRRRAVRATVVAGALAVVAWFAWPSPSPLPAVPQQVAKTHPQTRGVQVIAVEPGVLARLACGGPPAAVQFLDDDGLLRSLQQCGRDGTLLRCRGRTEVLPRVDDEWLQE